MNKLLAFFRVLTSQGLPAGLLQHAMNVALSLARGGRIVMAFSTTADSLAQYNRMRALKGVAAWELTSAVRRSVRMSVDALGRESYTRSLTTRVMAASPALTSLTVENIRRQHP